MSQADLCKLMKTSTSVIGRYERDEMTPSIDVARTLAKFLNTTVGYLLGEVDKADTFKDPAMLKRLHDLQALSDKDRDHILYALDGLLHDAKARKAYAQLKPLNWFLDGLVSLCHLVFAPWPDGEPDPSDLPRWARALIGAAFIAVLVAGVVWFD